MLDPFDTTTTWERSVTLAVSPNLCIRRINGQNQSVCLSILNEDNPQSARLEQARTLDGYTRGQMHSLTEDADLLIKIGFNNTVDVATETNAHVMFGGWDFSLQLKDVSNPAYQEGSAIISADWAIGARVAVAGWQIDQSVEVTTLADLHLAVEAGVYGSKIEVQLLGVDRELIRLFKPLMTRPLCQYTTEIHRALEELTSQIFSHYHTIEVQRRLLPSPTAVHVDLHRLGNRRGELPTEVILASEYYATERAVRGDSPDAAVAQSNLKEYQNRGHAIDSDLVRRYYKEFFGLSGEKSLDRDEGHRLYHNVLPIGR